MPLNSTFGFEAEFDENAQALAASLSNDAEMPNLCRTNELHRYHCECADCAFTDIGLGSVPDLHAQTDSSTNGEVISRVFDGIGQARPVMQALERHAVLTDAAPGYNAGFHVHVGNGTMSSEDYYDGLFEYMRFEAVLVDLASGRFQDTRDFNASVVTGQNYYLQSMPGYDRYHPVATLERIRTMGSAEGYEYKRALYTGHREVDRHSNLCTRTRHRTWEFRLWNSTRAAWRMELFIGLSRAFTNHDFIASLQSLEGPFRVESGSIDALKGALTAAGIEDVAALVDRQWRYSTGRQQTSTFPGDFEILAPA